jgi:hypothetical protein
VVELILIGGALVATAAITWIYCNSFIEHMVWSIGIYEGNPFVVYPSKRITKQPVLSASDVTDVRARFVADPFILYVGSLWNMFFEVYDEMKCKGVIGLATSVDGVSWRYEKVVLDAPFHLSYPYVFHSEGSFYMTPESVEAKAIYLYEAEKFPISWRIKMELLHGHYSDPTVFRKDENWYLFALRNDKDLSLHFSKTLLGPWLEHPMSPIVRSNRHISRPAGRLIEHDGKILRYTQDGLPSYGQCVRVFQIDEISVTTYKEHEIAESPILESSGEGWNAMGMHHIDLHPLCGKEWICCVDGRGSNVRPFSWSYGFQQFTSRLKNFREKY